MSHQAIHPKELPPFERPASPNTGDSDLGRKYQRQREKLLAKQERERQKLQSRQEHDHRRMERRNADEIERQPVEQLHHNRLSDYSKHTSGNSGSWKSNRHNRRNS